MHPGWDPHDLCNLTTSPASVLTRWDSVTDPIILPPNLPEGAQNFVPFPTDGIAFGPFTPGICNKPAWGKTLNEGCYTGPVAYGGSRRALSEYAKPFSRHSMDGPHFCQGSVNSLSAQGMFAYHGDRGNCGAGVGTSGNFSCNVGPWSSSVTSSGEIMHSSSFWQPGMSNYGVWDNFPRGSQGWVDQGDRQRRQIGYNYRESYGNRPYEHSGDNKWNSYCDFGARDSHILHGHPRPLVMRPPIPSMMPNNAPPPPFPYFYRPLAYPDFPPQMHMPTPHSQHFGGYHFNRLPAPQEQLPMSSSCQELKHTLILKQVEYYFSLENLCKDVYLRSHMDNNGWVSIHLIAGFKRMKLLTNNISLIWDALRHSKVVEVEGSKVRKRVGWDTWVLNRSNGQSSTEAENSSQRTENEEQLVSLMQKASLGEENGESGDSADAPKGADASSSDTKEE